MNSFNPDLTIQATESGGLRTYRIGLYVPRGESFVARCKSVSVSAGVADSIEIAVTRSQENVSEFVVTAIAGDINSAQATVRGGQSAELGRVIVSGEVPPDFEADLLDAIQRVFFRCMSDLVVASVAPTPVAAAVVAPASAGIAAQPVAAESLKARFANKRNAIAAVVLLAVGLIAYGAYGEFGPKAAQQDTLADINGTPDYTELQKQIQKQITEAAKSSGPAVNGINGQAMSNVAIETMKAMGLDPGKANAGCLVGVRQ